MPPELDNLFLIMVSCLGICSAILAVHCNGMLIISYLSSPSTLSSNPIHQNQTILQPPYPTNKNREEKPPITQLIELANVPRLVIGCQDPIKENAAKGAGTLHGAGVSVTMGVMSEDCNGLIAGYAELANTKIQKMARQHMKRFGRVSLV